MRRSSWFASGVLLVAAAALVSGCRGTTPTPPGGADAGSASVAAPARYVAGTTTTLVSQTVDAAGGVVEAPPGSPIAGVRVEFPAGALDAATTISLGHGSGTIQGLTDGAVQMGPILDIQSSGRTRFDQPIVIDFPVASSPGVLVPYHLDPHGHLRAMKVVGEANGRLRVASWHVSPKAVVGGPKGLKDSASTGFDPAHDGFDEENSSNEYAGGFCYGMSAFSDWYFLEAKSARGDLRSFVGGQMIQTKVGGEPVPAQLVIASRAQLSVSQDRPPFAVDADALWRVKQILKDTKRPVALELFTETQAHAVLAYGYHVSDASTSSGPCRASANGVPLQDEGVFDTYDPNEPGISSPLPFCAYGDRDGIKAVQVAYNDPDFPVDSTQLGYLGAGTFPWDEPFQLILDDAVAGFHAENMAHVTVSSPQPNAHVRVAGATLTGSVQSGKALVRRIQAFVDREDGTHATSKYFELPPGQHDFTVDLPIGVGKNQVAVQTETILFGGDWEMVWNDLSGVGNELEKRYIVIGDLDGYQGTLDELITLNTEHQKRDDFVHAAPVLQPDPVNPWLFSDDAAKAHTTMSNDLSTVLNGTNGPPISWSVCNGSSDAPGRAKLLFNTDRTKYSVIWGGPLSGGKSCTNSIVQSDGTIVTTTRSLPLIITEVGNCTDNPVVDLNHLAGTCSQTDPVSGVVTKLTWDLQSDAQ